MMIARKSRVLAVLFILVALSGGRLRADDTALDRYIRKPDPSYAWKLVDEVKGEGLTQYIIELTSQTWRTAKEVDQPVWKHWLIVVKPDKVVSETAFLSIGGGRNGGDAPKSAGVATILLAKETNTIGVELRMVPNQPLIFHGDGKPRFEDDLIAYTWDQFLKTGDDTWPAKLPMVKSVVKAMDCVQEFLASERGGKIRISRFVLGGGSKRGWTTWCTAAVDKRVAAIVPIVIDVLNVAPSIRHHAAAYGFYSLAIKDYYEHKIMHRLHEPRMKELLAIEDPYTYRDRYTMPIYMVNATGDQFFLPDSSQFYFNDLKGEKLLRYVPNGDHSLKGTDAPFSLVAFYQTIVNGNKRPKYSWTFAKDGSIQVKTESAPREVLLWQATNPKARDFRLPTIGKAFASRKLEANGDGTYIGKIDPPKEGWTAFLVELTYPTGGAFPLKVTTAVRVLPDTLPYGDVDPRKTPLETR